MKRLIAAAIILIILSSVFFTGYFSINSICKNTKEMLTECVNNYKSGNNPEESAEKLEEYWHSKESVLSLFADHTSIDSIELNLHLLRIYSTTNQKELFSEYSGRIKTEIHQLLEDTHPTVHSIF